MRGGGTAWPPASRRGSVRGGSTAASVRPTGAGDHAAPPRGERVAAGPLWMRWWGETAWPPAPRRESVRGGSTAASVRPTGEGDHAAPPRGARVEGRVLRCGGGRAGMFSCITPCIRPWRLDGRLPAADGCRRPCRPAVGNAPPPLRSGGGRDGGRQRSVSGSSAVRCGGRAACSTGAGRAGVLRGWMPSSARRRAPGRSWRSREPRVWL